MSQIKALFLDIDHTLYSHDQGRVPESCWRGLEEAKARGVLPFIATGRHKAEMLKLPVDWSFFEGFVTLNGAICYDKDFNLVASTPLSGVAREGLEALFASPSSPAMLVVEEDRMYINHPDPFFEDTCRLFSIPIPPVGQLGGSPVYQLVFFASRGQEDQIMEHLDGCTATRWNDWALDVISSDAGKDRGVRTMLSRHGLADDECLVFGDGLNDIPMLSAFPGSVAMGNASDEVKASARHVTSHIDDDGIYKALCHFHLCQ